MKLSVCIFAYNLEEFIANAIESALLQETDFEYEIVIGEDCSKDSTRAIALDYQNRYPGKIRVLCNERNLGIMENYSNTINHCRGEFIALMDGDDYWVSNRKLQAQVDFLTAHPEFTLSFHDAKILKTKGGWDKRTCCGADHKKIVTFNDVVCDVHIPTSSLVFRRSALTSFPQKWFNKLHCPDRPIFLMLLSNGPGYYFNELWSVYRKHPHGFWTAQDYQAQWRIHLQIYKLMGQHYGDRYKESFCNCETRVNYTLAINLIKDKEVKRALCFFRKYMRSRCRKSLLQKFKVYCNVFFFAVLYCKTRLALAIK
ncbi:glycosyltransferase family 2 protein [Niastella sp. OAS944]|uniref:glycosyltransferase family 2 protein n=1 Tax=Niastella sp. OAS944 TaxID=2664089 RepID=UPI00347713A8|nr:glycosyltransferase involved in cell wall biosynthesis [Chitinophagaceae bacterium OAS944]